MVIKLFPFIEQPIGESKSDSAREQQEHIMQQQRTQDAITNHESFCHSFYLDTGLIVFSESSDSDLRTKYSSQHFSSALLSLSVHLPMLLYQHKHIIHSISILVELLSMQAPENEHDWSLNASECIKFCRCYRCTDEEEKSKGKEWIVGVGKQFFSCWGEGGQGRCWVSNGSWEEKSGS